VDRVLPSFSGDPAVLAIGTTYLRTVGPFFGFFGMGYALYCVGQGTGRMGWPVASGVIRAAIAVAGGAAAIRLGANLDHIFMALSLGMMSFGPFRKKWILADEFEHTPNHLIRHK
jgi:Na+-driven multidrug efflux pump